MLELETFLPYRLNRAAAAISRGFLTVYGENYDLLVPEWRVLATLGEFHEMTAKQICQHSALHKTKVSRAVVALEQRRWLKRAVNEKDRREELLSLTVSGRKAYADIVPQALDFENALLASLSIGKMELLRTLQDIEEHVAWCQRTGKREVAGSRKPKGGESD